jgi:hypothetical protein
MFPSKSKRWLEPFWPKKFDLPAIMGIMSFVAAMVMASQYIAALLILAAVGFGVKVGFFDRAQTAINTKFPSCKSENWDGVVLAAMLLLSFAFHSLVLNALLLALAFFAHQTMGKANKQIGLETLLPTLGSGDSVDVLLAPILCILYGLSLMGTLVFAFNLGMILCAVALTLASLHIVDLDKKNPQFLGKSQNYDLLALGLTCALTASSPILGLIASGGFTAVAWHCNPTKVQSMVKKVSDTLRSEELGSNMGTAASVVSNQVMAARKSRAPEGRSWSGRS